MLAYGHARFKFRGKGFIETYILLGMMFPIQLGVLVNFKMINFFGLTNTLIGLILIYVGNLSLSSFLFIKFFRQLPIELAESAKIDGANEFTIFARIMLPLSKPVIGTVTLVCGLTIYNDFYMPLIFLNGNNRTATVILQTFLQNFLRFIDRIFPMAVISIVPIIILFIFAQNQLVEGLTVGAIKD
jgi:raffinose/stachyose/melibiose transport system permease protein